ncbi:MAG: hypothetical protein ICV73_19750 [Acetobacteraceae bacterium]|jgi:hypothetical protein|nr:hypothetical protein [Acetobacteraceae bacterium]
MAHSVFLRTSLAAGYVADHPATHAPEWRPLEPAKRLLQLLNSRIGPGYRPELHYMRGGRTPGAKSLASR